MSEDRAETSEEVVVDRLDPGVREIISIVSEYLDNVENIASLDNFSDGTYTR